MDMPYISSNLILSVKDNEFKDNHCSVKKDTFFLTVLGYVHHRMKAAHFPELRYCRALVNIRGFYTSQIEYRSKDRLGWSLEVINIFKTTRV